MNYLFYICNNYTENKMFSSQIVSTLLKKYGYPTNDFIIKAFNKFIKNKNKSSIILATLIKIEYENENFTNCYQSSTYASCKYKLHKELDCELSDEEVYFSERRGGTWSKNIKLTDIFDELDK